MKKFTLSLLSLLAFTAGLTTTAAHAEDVRVAAAMQRCSTNEECALVTNSCQDNCGFVPIHKENLVALQGQYQARCGKPMEANPTCNINPPIAAACVNARCTIDYAYANNSSAADYQAGAYAVPEAPVPSKVPAEAYKGIDDKHGFTAYNLPQNEVREGTVGTLHTTVYVPPSSPVSGGNYVPVTPGVATPPPTAATPVPATTPVVPPTIPPAAIPSNTTYATPPTIAPTPHYQAPAAPAYVPPVAPTNVPHMTPSVPNQLPPGYVDTTTGAAAPAVPTQPYEYVAPETIVTAPPVPTPPPVPVAPPGSKPIPPSDLKPVESLVTPAGGTVPVNPEDPGAPPPEGSSIILKDGKLGVSTTTTSGKTKSFTAEPQSDTQSKKLGSFN